MVLQYCNLGTNQWHSCEDIEKKSPTINFDLQQRPVYNTLTLTVLVATIDAQWEGM